MEIIRRKVTIDCDLTFTTFYSGLEEFKEIFGFLPKCLVVSIAGIDVAKVILKEISPRDYEGLKDRIDLGFEFRLDENFQAFHWELEGIKDDTKYILYSDGA